MSSSPDFVVNSGHLWNISISLVVYIYNYIYIYHIGCMMLHGWDMLGLGGGEFIEANSLALDDQMSESR